MRTFKNIAFKGGGVLGICYAGAIKALEEQLDFSQIEGASGTSAGAVAALMVSLNYTASETHDYIIETDFKQFQDHRNLLHLPNKYGIYKGDFLLKWIRGVLEKKKVDINITFKQFSNRGYKNLKVYACNLSEADLTEFSAEKTPDIIIAEAIRASMSIPLFFEAWKFADGLMDDAIFVDGGLLYNFPITAFNDTQKTLGLYINTNDALDEELEFGQMQKYIRHLFKAMLNGQDIDFFRNYNKKQVIVLDSLGISSTNFNISVEDRERLFNASYKAASEFVRQ